MSYKHPDYSHLTVYEGGNGENPREGSFYVPKRGDTLSWIAYKAYGNGTFFYFRTLKRSVWNQQHYTYREASDKCTSAKTTPPKGWPALCPPYKPLWIPPYETAYEPWEVSTEALTPMPDLPTGIRPEDAEGPGGQAGLTPEEQEESRGFPGKEGRPGGQADDGFGPDDAGGGIPDANGGNGGNGGRTTPHRPIEEAGMPGGKGLVALLVLAGIGAAGYAIWRYAK